MNRRSFPGRIICSVFYTILTVSWCYGQENYKSENGLYWFNFGVGCSSYGYSIGGNVSFQRNNYLASLRTIYNSEIDLRFIETRLYERNPNRIYDIGLMQGFILKNNHESVSLSTGISVVNNVVRGRLLSCSGWIYNTCSYEMINHTVIGIPLELELFWTARDVGIGVYCFANFNSESSYVGVLFCVRVNNPGSILLIDKKMLERLQRVKGML
jgi:hypothetical protein